MKYTPVRFCVGCGQLLDDIQPAEGQGLWINAHAYLIKYGLQWHDLVRIDDACPACARLFAIARRGSLSDGREAETEP